jgi:hypothetical protein
MIKLWENVAFPLRPFKETLIIESVDEVQTILDDQIVTT